MPVNEAEQVTRQLVSAAGLVPACKAAAVVPEVPGWYSIFTDHCDDLPSPFRDCLRAHGTTLLYVGMASGNLLGRLVCQDLRHKSPSTFFRGIGAILGFRPLPGSLMDKRNRHNYQFSPEDTRSIIRWIDSHLSVKWVVAQPGQDIEDIEGACIAALCPILNTAHNPRPLTKLAVLRKECRCIAWRGRD